MIKDKAAPFFRVGNYIIKKLRPSRPGFRILLFHDVPASSFHAFEEFVSYVSETYGVLSPNQASAWLDGYKVKAIDSANWPYPCLFTFDDGFVSNFNLAKTILNRHDLKCLFFINPGLIDLSKEKQGEAIAKNIFDGDLKREELHSELRLMAWTELLELKNDGHQVGCHGMFHRRLSELSGSSLHQEIVLGGDLLDERLSQKTDWYAYAFGDISSINRTALSIISGRYSYCRSGLRGINNKNTQKLALKADAIDLETSHCYQKFLSEGGADYKYLFKNKLLKKWVSKVS